MPHCFSAEATPNCTYESGSLPNVVILEFCFEESFIHSFNKYECPQGIIHCGSPRGRVGNKPEDPTQNIKGKTLNKKLHPPILQAFL